MIRSSSPSTFGGRFFPVDELAVQSIAIDAMHMSAFAEDCRGA